MPHPANDDELDPREVPGLARLEPETVKALLKRGRLVHIPKGWTPIRAQEPSDEAYLLLEGRVEVVDGHETIASVGRGQFIGEIGLVEKTLRTARVTVTDPVLALAWPRPEFQEMRERLPEFDRLVTATARRREDENRRRG